MDLQQKIDILSKIVLPCTFFIGGILGSFIGYFISIHKERINTKWEDGRKALKDIYNIIMVFEKIIIDTEYEKVKPLLEKMKVKMSYINSKTKIYKDLETFYNAFYMAYGTVKILRDFEKEDFESDQDAEYEKIYEGAKIWVSYAVNKIEPMLVLLKKELV